jgi:hypothetical protein
MMTYQELKTKPSEFLCATGLNVAEFEQLLPVFGQAYRVLYPVEQTLAGEARQRQVGGGAQSVLASLADKLLFILVYAKVYPLQTMHGLQFGLSQGRVNYWIHHLLPVLQCAFSQLKLTPVREASQLAASPALAEAAADLLLDGSERRRQRPQEAEKQVEHYSGKKKRIRIRTYSS